MENIFWELTTGDDRHTAIGKIKTIVAGHGDIIDFNRFSDISLAMKVEIRESCLAPLYAELKRHFGIGAFDGANLGSNRERTLFLNITFGAGTGDFRVETPAVPG